MIRRGIEPDAERDLSVVTGGVTGRAWTVVADDGTPLHAEETLPEDGGQPEVTVVGVHGFALSAASWHFQRRALAEVRAPRVRQIYYDHRGHGRSGRAGAETCTLEQLARDLGAVVESLAPTGPVVLAGHSMGGMTIMELTQQRPELFAERVRGVSLITTSVGELGRSGPLGWLLSSSGPLAWTACRLAPWQLALVERVRAAGGSLTRSAVRALAFGTAEPSPALVEFVLGLLNAHPVGELAKFLRTLSAHDRQGMLAALQDVLVQVIGADGDLVTPFSHSERIAAELPAAQLVRIPAGGHLVHLQHPDLVNEYLIDLLGRVSEAAHSPCSPIPVRHCSSVRTDGGRDEIGGPAGGLVAAR